jgi:hypothetical protein
VADANAIAILVPTLVTLDAIATRGAGRMAIIPRPVAQVSASEYNGWQFVAWPQQNLDAIAQAATRLGFYGDPLVRITNFTAAELINADKRLQFTVIRGSLSTVDDVRTRLRKQLEQLGVQLSPAPATPAPSKKFPWAWILGTVAFGLGLGYVLYSAEKLPALPGDSE